MVVVNIRMLGWELRNYENFKARIGLFDFGWQEVGVIYSHFSGVTCNQICSTKFNLSESPIKSMLDLNPIPTVQYARINVKTDTLLHIPDRMIQYITANIGLYKNVFERFTIYIQFRFIITSKS